MNDIKGLVDHAPLAFAYLVVMWWRGREEAWA
jgi:hypothetical protein